MKDKIVQEIIREGRILEVGGCVRDSLLDHPLPRKDIDYLIQGIPFERLKTMLTQYGRVDLVGRSFGVIKFTDYSQKDTESATVDISLPRSERSTGTGHTDFEVDFDHNLSVEEDLKRRDFTINAIARDLHDKVLIDPFDGRSDLTNKIIRMVSPESFSEDPLRMMRAIQFAARFEFEIEPVTYQALKDNVDLIETISSERIAEELNKMFLLADKPSIGLRLMEESGLLEKIIPEMIPAVGCQQPGGFHAFDVFEHIIRMVDECKPRLALRLAALFHDITKPQHKQLTDTGASFYGHESSGSQVARKILKRLRYSKEIINDVSLLVEKHMFTTDVGPKGLRRFIRRVGQRLIPDLLDLRRADVIAQGMGGTTEDVDEMFRAIEAEIARKSPFGRSDLAINGRTIRKVHNLEESPVIGEIIDYLLEKVLDNPEENEPEILDRHVREFLNDRNKTNEI